MSTAPTQLTCEQLSSFSPMDFLTPHYRQQLHASLQYLQYPAGTPLLQRGERSVAQYYLLEGRVSVDGGSAGKQHIEGGSAQAHLPLNPGQSNPASIRAVTAVRLFAVEHQLLQRLLGWSQEAAYQVSSLGELQVEEQEDDWLARLLATPLFGRLPPSHLHALLARFEYVEARAGERVVGYGEPGEHFFVLKRGRAQVSLPAAYRDQPALVLERGDFFGEEALVSGAVRSASVIMLEDGELARLHRDDFVELVRPTLIPRISKSDLQRLDRRGSVRTCCWTCAWRPSIASAISRRASTCRWPTCAPTPTAWTGRPVTWSPRKAASAANWPCTCSTSWASTRTC